MSPLPSICSFTRLTATAIALAVFAMPGCSDEIVSVVPVASVGIQPGQLALMEGESAMLSAVLRGSAGEVLSGRSVEWSSDADEIVVVDATGRVTAGVPGQTTIRVVSEGVEGTATVAVLTGPTIQTSESSLTFHRVAGQAGAMEREVQVTNSQGGVLSGLTASVVRHDAPSTPWLQDPLLLGSTAPTSVVVIVRVLNLAPGTYRGVVRLESQVAENSPYSIEVELVVEEAPPELRVNPTSLALAGVTGDVDSASLPVDVENAGGGTIGSLHSAVRYPDGEPEGWLEAEFDSDEVPTTMDVRASPRALAPGTYRGVVDVSSPDAVNELVSVEVVFTVSPRTGGVSASQEVVRGAAARGREEGP